MKEGQIWSDGEHSFIILKVTLKDIKKGIAVTTPGLYGFYGLWYGSDRFKIKNYGKIIDLFYEDPEQLELVFDSTIGKSNKDLKIGTPTYRRYRKTAYRRTV